MSYVKITIFKVKLPQIISVLSSLLFCAKLVWSPLIMSITETMGCSSVLTKHGKDETSNKQFKLWKLTPQILG